MAPRISPFSLKSKKSSKQVSFSDNTVEQIERILQEEKASVWYSQQEMEMFQSRDSYTKAMKSECSPESWLRAQSHVRNVTTKCRHQLERADGHWDHKRAKALSKVAISGSKEHRDAATKRAKKVCKEVYPCDVPKFRRIMNKVLPSRGATQMKPKLERRETEVIEITETAESMVSESAEKSMTEACTRITC